MPANVLVVCASIRSTGRLNDALVAAARDTGEQGAVVERLRGIKSKYLCNTEVLSAIAMAGAVSEGAEVRYRSLRKLFPVGKQTISEAGIETMGLDADASFVDTSKVSAEALQDLLDVVAWADAVVLTTPVYFGDRGSPANTFLKILNERDALRGKAFAAATAAAKRNGGQETAAIYALFDAMAMGAVIHGNGPKTCQYGGTAWGGDRRAVLDDEIGVETTFHTGRRAAQIGEILRLARGEAAPVEAPLRLHFVITADTPQREVQREIEQLIAHLDDTRVEPVISNLLDFHVDRCLGCNICPYPPMVEKGSKKGTDYACIIDSRRDQVEDVREVIKTTDALVFVGTNAALPGLIDRYQEFTERTRFVRRNNFELTNRPFTSLVIKDLTATRERLFGLRVMTSYMRHNMLGYEPIRVLRMDGQHLKVPGYDPAEHLARFAEHAIAVRAARAELTPQAVSYVAGGIGGYADTRLDDTVHLRR